MLAWNSDQAPECKKEGMCVSVEETRVREWMLLILIISVCLLHTLSLPIIIAKRKIAEIINGQAKRDRDA